MKWIPLFLFSIITISHLLCCLLESIFKNKSISSNFSRIADTTKPGITLTLALVVFVYFPIMDQSSNIDNLRLGILISAILFGMLGDIFLLDENNKNRFIAGLISFLFGHFCFLSQLVPKSNFWNFPWYLHAIAIIGYTIGILGIYKTTKKQRGFLGFSIIIYSTTLSFLHYICTCRFISSILNNEDISFALLSFIGATCFVISDNILAIRIFKTKFRFSRFIIMASYSIAEILLALSFL